MSSAPPQQQPSMLVEEFDDAASSSPSSPLPPNSLKAVSPLPSTTTATAVQREGGEEGTLAASGTAQAPADGPAASSRSSAVDFSEAAPPAAKAAAEAGGGVGRLDGDSVAKKKSGINTAALTGVSKALKAFAKNQIAAEKKREDKDKDNQHSAKKDAFLIDACQQGSLDLVKKFITENGCSPNLKSPGDGKSLVQLALEGGHESIVLYLFVDHNVPVAVAKGLRGIRLDEPAPDCFHISLLRTCVLKTSDREKGFQLCCEALAHSSNPTLTALLLAEMYDGVAKIQPTHRHTLEANKEILQKVAFSFLDQARENEVMLVLGGMDPAFGNQSPLSVAIRSHNSLFISHPLVQDFVQHMWKGEDPLQVNFDSGGIGQKKESIIWDFVLKPKIFFKSPRGIFFLQIYMYLIFILFHGIVSNDLGERLGNTAEYVKPNALEYVFWVLTLCGFVNELEKIHRQGWNNYLTFFWNYADVLLFFLLILFIALRIATKNSEDPSDESETIRTVLAASAIPLYVRLLEMLVLSRRFGPLMLIIQTVLAEVFYFLFLALLMIIAFGQCCTVLFNSPGKEVPAFETFSGSCVTLFFAMLNVVDGDLVHQLETEYSVSGPFTLILFLVINSVILLNLLIAILSNIYKKIDDKSNEEWMYLWASTVMRLQKEVQETLPPPLNILLRLFIWVPIKPREKLIFFFMLLIQYIPGLIFASCLIFIPNIIIQLLSILGNPSNYIKGHGNPFRGSATIDPVGPTTQEPMVMGFGQRTWSFRQIMRQFWEDNFTDTAELMRGRETVTFQFDSKNRGTMIDERVLFDKNIKAYAEKIQTKRDQLKEVLSMSNGDAVSMLTEVMSSQKENGDYLHAQEERIAKLAEEMGNVQSLLRLANKNITALVKSVGEISKSEAVGAASAAAAPAPAVSYFQKLKQSERQKSEQALDKNEMRAGDTKSLVSAQISGPPAVIGVLQSSGTATTTPAPHHQQSAIKEVDEDEDDGPDPGPRTLRPTQASALNSAWGGVAANRKSKFSRPKRASVFSKF